ncbi:MAG: hypothetical protein KF799_03100 [Bdellovibrionales bacterium]|nr:hypothetical protein [Bdellovibrionales bacterium]
MGSNRNYILAIAIVAGLLTTFQNCGQAKFSSSKDDNLSTLGPPPVTICDPFSTNTTCPPNPPPGGGPTPGLKANVYHYPNGTKVDDYINLGQKLPVLIQMSHLDIPLRSWQSGFPGPNGGVRDAAGDLLIEWFALDLSGFFQLPTSVNQGDYQLALHSDDGSILSLDGYVVVNNDGTHAMQWACAPAKITLNHADKHTMRLKYYQGPRTEIGLQVYMRPWADKNRPCDASGGWTIIPAAGLTH